MQGTHLQSSAMWPSGFPGRVICFLSFFSLGSGNFLGGQEWVVHQQGLLPDTGQDMTIWAALWKKTR